MHIRPAHHAVLCYAEWCCDNGRPWPKWSVIAADLARDERDLRAAFSQLEEWGLVSVRYTGTGHARTLRLGDGRETPAYIHNILVIHRGASRAVDGNILPVDARIAA
jgi:hypothetical protein